MAQGMIHRLLGVFMDAAKKLNLQCECAEMEWMAVMVHRVMTYQSRQFHTLEHVFGFLDGADPQEALAAVFHDLVYYQVDDGLPPDLESIVGPYIDRKGSEIRLAAPGTPTGVAPGAPTGAAAGLSDVTDSPYRDCLAIFGFRPGQALAPFSGLNEFLSALVMMKAMERYMPRETRIAIAVCIEASIPFRGTNAEGREIGEELEARLAAMQGVDGVADMIHRAIAFANTDVKDFALSDPGLFLANTWKLLPESNAPLRYAGAFRVREYRVALQKMLGFFRSLRPDTIYHSYRGIPEGAVMKRQEEAARRNLDYARAYLQAKLLAVGLIEAVADVSGGDAPISLFMGDLPQCREEGDCLTSYLPAVPAPPWIHAGDPVYRLLKDGRLTESSFDLTNSPLALHLRHRLPPDAWETRIKSSEDFFAGKISAENHIMGFDPSLRSDFLGACARMVPTRKNALESWLKAHPGT